MTRKLTDSEKAYVVEKLAAWEPPSNVAHLVNQTFGIEISRQQVEKYDPTKQAGRSLSRRWREHFVRSREAFRNDLSDIPAANKVYRIRKLARMADKAERSGNLLLAARMLEQIAKEVGDLFVALRQRPDRPSQSIGSSDVTQMTDEQIEAELLQLLSRASVERHDSKV